jgi:WD40-like Beta Propeller Repeat
MEKYLLFILLTFNSFIYAQDTLKFSDLYGDYLGQTLPSDTPVVFARGIVSTDDLEHSPAIFTPDGNEVYWITARPPSANNSDWINRALTMKRVNEQWSAPFIAPYHITALSPDGKCGYFTSQENKDIWISKKQGDKWSRPKCLNFLTQYPELKFAYVGSITRNGTLYFTAYLEGPLNNYGIYRTKLINGNYEKPEALSSNINMASGTLNWTPFINPDENYLIFSSNRKGEFGGSDLYISFHDINKDTWSEPINMGEPINTAAQERLPWISPDSKYLFFTRWTPDHNQDVFWVSAKIIERLREKNNIK